MKVRPITLNPNKREDLATSHGGRSTRWINNGEQISRHPKPSSMPLGFLLSKF